MKSLSFQISTQKNEAKLSSFENEMASYRALLLYKAKLPMFLTVLEHCHIKNDFISCTVL